MVNMIDTTLRTIKIRMIKMQANILLLKKCKMLWYN